MAKGQRLTIKDIEVSSGKTLKTYVVTQTRFSATRTRLRLDDTSIAALTPTSFYHPSHILSYLRTLFLPTGYPHTVTADYTPYQIYDSLQAFASSIASLLSSRAVLQSLNIVSTETISGTLPSTSTSAATAATILAVFQATLSDLTTILFASHAAPRISADVKYYRFLADVVNDAAFMLDLLAPSLPSSFTPRFLPYMEIWSPFIPSPRVLVLCTSSMLRAICGVAGGSSKAVLSSHFARNNPENVGDLNAKDSSQETVIGLLGMWAGGFIVSRVESVRATWIWMVSLLILHLWTNLQAVKSVRLGYLNLHRAGMVMYRLREMEHVEPGTLWADEISVDAIGGNERILGLRRRIFRAVFNISDLTINAWKIGISATELFIVISHAASNDLEGENPKIVQFLKDFVEIFKEEKYVFSYDDGLNMCIALKKGARPEDQWRAFVHVYLFTNELMEAPDDTVLVHVQKSMDKMRQVMPRYEEVLLEAGWDLSATSLDNGRGIRVEIV